MSEYLKQKTIKSIFWSAIDNSSYLLINFIIGIILARLLSPKEFGLIGMITVFITISQTFIDIGFTQALIRKKECNSADYSTVFLTNICTSVLLIIALNLLANPIGNFYQETELGLIIRVISIIIFFNALSSINKTKLIKSLDFKSQTKITIISSILSGILAIISALLGYGIWSLVIKTLLFSIISTILYWYYSFWKFELLFSKVSFRELFSYGYKLTLSGLIDTIYRNLYYLIIGKYFSAVELGYYSRADQFQTLPSQNLTSIIQRVSLPVLASIQDEKITLKLSYQRLIKTTMFFTFIIMMVLVAISEPLILFLIGDKWEKSIIYLQLLCFVGMLYPLQALNLNMLQVKGRSDLFLYLEIIKKALAIPIVIIGISLGIKPMIMGMILITIISYFLNSFWSGKLINYSAREQLKDIAPSFLLATIIGSSVYLINKYLHLSNFIELLIGLGLAIILVSLISEIFKIETYLYIKKIVYSYLKPLANKI